MADKSAIEWTDATWNPIVGCSIVSPGCTNCYAMKMAARIERMGGAPHYDDLTQGSKAGPVWTGKVAAAPRSILDQPMHWRRPRRIFVNSMGDPFHEAADVGLIDHVVAVMYRTPQHTYQVLTKRAARMQRYWTDTEMPARIAAIVAWMCPGDNVRTAVANNIREQGFPNVWLGVSTERQQEADERIPLLLQTPAAVRFISAEPLLGPIDLMQIQFCPNDRGQLKGRMSCLGGGRDTENPWHLNWVIVGGESGPRARPMHPQWARSLRDQCEAVGIPFFFKQWGEWLPMSQSYPEGDYGRQSLSVFDGGNYDARAYRVGKKRAGRLLDGREHNGLPRTASLRSPVTAQPSNAEVVVS